MLAPTVPEVPSAYTANSWINKCYKTDLLYFYYYVKMFLSFDDIISQRQQFLFNYSKFKYYFNVNALSKMPIKYLEICSHNNTMTLTQYLCMEKDVTYVCMYVCIIVIYSFISTLNYAHHNIEVNVARGVLGGFLV